MQRSAFQGHFHPVEEHPDGAKPCGQQDDDGPSMTSTPSVGKYFRKSGGSVPHMDFVQQIVVESRHIASGAAGKDDDFVRGRNTGGSEAEPAVARRSGARRKILGRPKGTDLYVVLMQLHPDMANIEVDLSVFGDGFVKMSPQHHDGVAGIVGIFPASYSPPGTDLRLIDACKRISCTSREDLPLPARQNSYVSTSVIATSATASSARIRIVSLHSMTSPPRYSLTYSHMFSKSHGGAADTAREELFVWSVHL